MEREKMNIGTIAGVVWNRLQGQGSISLPELARRLRLGAEDVTLAVGWLAREDKVYLERKNGTLLVRLC